ncbi:MAG: DUF3021 domain-containing protein [Lachnospiraceae bacterium]|nr:DUF3021 domain-containing protein [Lachnospiraceae bacterium]
MEYKMDTGTKIIFLSSIGFALGVIMGTIITAVTATMSINDGTMYICAPEFTLLIGDELKAFAIQSVVSGLIGAVNFGGTVAYSIEEWSLVRATSTHFVLCMTSVFTGGFFLKWFSLDNLPEILITFLVMMAAYIMIWLIMYLRYKAEINEINRDLPEWKNSHSAYSN